MTVYLDLVIILNFAVDFLLIAGTNRLCGYPPGYLRAAAAAALGGGYAGFCMLPGTEFLAGLTGRLLCLASMAAIAFGLHRTMFRRSAVFLLLSMALGGIGTVMGRKGFWPLMLSALGVGLLCAATGSIGQRGFVPVELSYRGRRLKITALRDTGNVLRDPVTGGQVLVVGAEVAQKLTGLSRQQLHSPVETVGAIPGLRLIPYRAVGQPGSMLLALRLSGVKIGSWKGSSLVAFAPEGLDGTYQALTGGIV